MFKEKFYRFYRVFVLGLQNFVRNAWLTIAATAVMTVAITFVLAGIILNTTSRNVTTHLSENLKISVYFQPEVTPQDITQLQAVFEDNEAVAETIYIDSQIAQKRFTESYSGDIEIGQAVALVGEGVFPPSLEISVSDLNQINNVAALAETEAYEEIVESISLGKADAQRTVERATTVQNTLIQASVIFSLVFAIVAFLIIFNTIRMAIFSRREEIQIMSLIGAPWRFIREPFLVEASLYGSIGGVLAFSIIYAFIWFFGDSIEGVAELSNSYAYFAQNKGVILLMFAGAIAGGVVVSTLSCILALQKHLKL